MAQSNTLAPDSSLKPAALISTWPFALVAAALAVVCYLNWSNPPFGPDAWANFELSESLRHGAYRFDHLRHFSGLNPNAPSISFPPLWPAVWSMLSATTAMGARSGFVLAFCCTLLFVVVSEAVGRKLIQTRWIGLCAAMLAIQLPGYVEAMLSASPIAMQLLLVSAALWLLLLRERFDIWQSASLGLICGLLVMNRFDGLPFALMLGIATFAVFRSPVKSLVYALSLLVIISPWIWMSQHFYGTWFASDNSIVAISADPHTFVRDWYGDGSSPPTVFDQPLAWLRKVFGNLAGLIIGTARSAGFVGLGVMVALFSLILARGERFRGKMGVMISGATAKNILSDAGVRSFLMIFVSVLAMLPLLLLSGYFEVRYFVLLNWMIFLGLGGVAASLWRSHFSIGRVERLAMCGACVALVALVVRAGDRANHSPDTFPSVSNGMLIKQCVAASSTNVPSRVLVMNGTLAAQLSAVYNIPTSFTPSNFERKRPDDAQARQFFSTFGITHILGSPQEIATMFAPHLFAATGGSCPLDLQRVYP